MKDVLVAYGSERGGTAGLAEMVVAGLGDVGLDAEARPAAEVDSLDGYAAVVLGGAIYAGRWHKDARRFAKRHHQALQQMPVWLFSSGPLDDSATEKDIAPIHHVARLISDLGARGHVTFGGRLEADADGFMAAAMAKEHAGDWRDQADVDDWCANIARELAMLGS